MEPKLWHRYRETADGPVLVFVHRVARPDHGSDYGVFRELETGREVMIGAEELRTLPFVGPPEMEVVALAPSQDAAVHPARSDLAALARHGDYFRALLEGRDRVASWFAWLDAHDRELALALTRSDYLRMRLGARPVLERILASAGTSVTPSYRYGWAIGYAGS